MSLIVVAPRCSAASAAEMATCLTLSALRRSSNKSASAATAFSGAPASVWRPLAISMSRVNSLNSISPDLSVSRNWISDAISFFVADRPTSLKSASTSPSSMAPEPSASILSNAAFASDASLSSRGSTLAPISPKRSSSLARSVANISTNSSNSIFPDLSASNAAVASSRSVRSYLMPSLWRQAPRRRVSMDPEPWSNMEKTAWRPGLLRDVTGAGADFGRFDTSSPAFQPRGFSGSCSRTLASRPAWSSCVEISPLLNLPSLSHVKYLP
mmetsp:Transcript_29933/g.101721  ORF Transcript_29933/g.101721 Transcript_29933/m.101721 type:complete len:270 (-) Transcript_29933:245-1054(-)